MSTLIANYNYFVKYATVMIHIIGKLPSVSAMLAVINLAYQYHMFSNNSY